MLAWITVAVFNNLHNERFLLFWWCRFHHQTKLSSSLSRTSWFFNLNRIVKYQRKEKEGWSGWLRKTWILGDSLLRLWALLRPRPREDVGASVNVIKNTFCTRLAFGAVPIDKFSPLSLHPHPIHYNKDYSFFLFSLKNTIDKYLHTCV